MTKKKIIVDTHIFIWDLIASPKLTPDIKSFLDRNADNLYLCDITLWEVGMLVGKSKLNIQIPVNQFCKIGIKYRSYKMLSITPDIADKVAEFANDINKDPADRIITATTIVYDGILITQDRDLKKYSFVNTEW